MAAFEVLALDTATPQIRAPGAADTYTFPRAITPSGANVTPFTISGYSLTGANAQSLIDLSGTWNTTGTPTALKLNVTDTASNAASLLMDLQVGGVGRASVRKDGRLTLRNGNPTVGVCEFVTGDFDFSIIHSNNTVGFFFYGFQLGGFSTRNTVTSSISIGGNLTTDPQLIFGSRTTIFGEAANTLAQRNGVNAQTLRVYNTFTDASNYERTAITTAAFGGVRYQQILAESAGTGAANLGVVIQPKGTGAFSLQMPDGTTTGGNARGAGAVCLLLSRDGAGQGATGPYSFAVGRFNTASGSGAFVFGNDRNSATGTGSFAGGNNSVSATGAGSFAFGSNCSASGSYATVIGVTSYATAYGSFAFGTYAVSNKIGQLSYGLSRFSGDGDAQWSVLGLRGSTSNATVTELFLHGSANDRATIPANTTWMADVNVIARSQGGTDNACFKRRCIIKRDGANNTALVGTVQTIDTDIGSNAGAPPAGWAVTITADDTNESLKVEVTGATATNIRWVAKVDLVEVGYAA